eukprot:4687-Heterococcus_DN1.PRE.7
MATVKVTRAVTYCVLINIVIHVDWYRTRYAHSTVIKHVKLVLTCIFTNHLANDLRISAYTNVNNTHSAQYLSLGTDACSSVNTS